MIKIDADLYYIANKFNISSQRISQYAGKSIDEIMESEAAQGNTQAAKFDVEVLNNPTELMKLLKLSTPANRHAILQNLNQQDLEALLPLLEKNDLVFGLNFFTKDKLLKLVGNIPKDQLVKYVFQMFSQADVMKMMPVEQMDKLLTSPDLDKGQVLKYLKSMNPEVLAQIIESATGKKVESMDQQDLIGQIAGLNPEKYREALTSIPEEKKREFIFQMAKENPKLYEMFDADAYEKMLNQKDKPDLVKAAQSIEPDQLIKMMGELPQDLLAIVVTQINPKDFADVLTSKYKDVLTQIAAG